MCVAPCSCCLPNRDNFQKIWIFVDIYVFQTFLSTSDVCLWCNFVLSLKPIWNKHTLLLNFMWITEKTKNSTESNNLVYRQAGTNENGIIWKTGKSKIWQIFLRDFSHGCYSLFLLFLISSNSKHQASLWITRKFFFNSLAYRISKYVLEGRDDQSHFWV